jgi:diadenosine tetraphosphate (Ap4A) HIT family hydrolase
MSAFELHAKLAGDCEILGDLVLSRILLMRDANYPWVIMVPKVNNIQEIYQLSYGDQQLLMKEIAYVGEQMQVLFKADKMNVAALGNMVPQLHVHVVARYADDIAWPNPVWGKVDPLPYKETELNNRAQALREVMSLA